MKTFLQALAISLELNLGLDQVLVPETHTENHECTKTSSDLVSNIQQGLYYWYNTDTSNKKGSSFPIRKNNYTNRIVEISILIEFIIFFNTFISIKP